MRPPYRNPDGQAALEMLLALPLLLLLAAGLFQTALLFLNDIQFENACGQAAREWADGGLADGKIADAVWDDLGPYQKYFQQGSIQVQSQPIQPKGTVDSIVQACRQGLTDIPVLGQCVQGVLFNYTQGSWRITAKFRSRPLLGLLFPDGIPLTSSVCIIRHPADAL